MKKDRIILALKILAPIVAIILAVFISSLVILAIDKDPLQVFILCLNLASDEVTV